MSKSHALTNWHPASWHGLPATQQPKYADQRALERTVAALSRLPPLVVSWEVEALRDKLAKAQLGEQFLLQGGDCAESFDGLRVRQHRPAPEDPAADEPGAAAGI